VSSIALYYPWSQFRDDQWLKLALLMWDNVARIRPPGISSHDSALVRRICDDTKFVINISPDEAALAQVCQTFLELLQAYEDQLIATYAPIGHSTGPPVERRSTGDPAKQFETSESSLTWIYIGSRGRKIAEPLVGRLIEAGLAVERPGRNYLGFHPRLGSIYMAVLAEVIAAKNRLSPTTDQPLMYSAIGATDRLMTLALEYDEVDLTPDPTSAYLQFAIRSVILPNRLSEVPVKKLIHFHTKYQPELSAFREHITDLANELEDVAATENREIAYAHLNNIYKTKTKPQLDDLRHGLRSLGVESTLGTLALKVDVGATAATTILGGVAAAEGQWVIGSAALAIGTTRYLVGKFAERREKVRKSPATYLLRIQNELNSKSLLQALRRAP
jgi:hypothetical protein